MKKVLFKDNKFSRKIFENEEMIVFKGFTKKNHELEANYFASVLVDFNKSFLKDFEYDIESLEIKELENFLIKNNLVYKSFEEARVDVDFFISENSILLDGSSVYFAYFDSHFNSENLNGGRFTICNLDLDNRELYRDSLVSCRGYSNLFYLFFQINKKNR